MNNYRFSFGTIAFALAIGINLVLQMIFAIILSTGANADITQFIFMMVLQSCNILIVYLLRKKTASKPNFAFFKPCSINILLTVVLTVLTLVGCYISTVWLTDFLTDIGVKAGVISLDGWNLVLAIFCTCILAPVGEELIYRYALLGGLKEKFSPVVSVILCALAFSLMHMSPHQTFYQFFLGLALGTIAIKTGNIILCITMHALSNLLAITLSLFPAIDTVFLSSPIFIVVGIVVLALCVFAFFVLSKKLKMERPYTAKRDKNEQNEEYKIGIAVYVFALIVCLFVWALAFFG